MAASQSTKVPASAEGIVARSEARHMKLAVDLLGGPRALHVSGPPTSEDEAHTLVERGIPAEALVRIFETFKAIPFEEKLAAVGISARSFARRKAAPKTRLPLGESERLWRFALLLGQATKVFGSPEGAEEWMTEPALGLEYQRPIEVLTTNPGALLVHQYLGRIEFCVYT
jgi:putative toxin-antitoxin system antitoxin component (TIGR02293 family)